MVDPEDVILVDEIIDRAEDNMLADGAYNLAVYLLEELERRGLKLVPA